MSHTSLLINCPEFCVKGIQGHMLFPINFLCCMQATFVLDIGTRGNYFACLIYSLYWSAHITFPLTLVLFWKALGSGKYSWKIREKITGKITGKLENLYPDNLPSVLSACFFSGKCICYSRNSIFFSHSTTSLVSTGASSEILWKNLY